MSAADTLSYNDVQQRLAQWKTSGGPTQEEQDKFMEDAINDLNDAEKAKAFQANIEQVGIWANDVDAAFARVKRGLADMVRKYGTTFPELAGFRDDFNGYNERWVSHLNLSRDVASQHVTLLRRFDQIFLDMVENIQSEQDRKDCIVELQQFIDEDHGDSEKMAKGFTDLKNDVALFLTRFDDYIKQKGEELAAKAEELRRQIDSLNSSIESLNWEIAAAVVALVASVSGAATLVGLLGVVAAEATLAILVARRVKAELDLRKAKSDLAEVNKQQEALAHVKSEFDQLKPDINLICEKLTLFGQVWQSIRADSVSFQTHLKQGMEAATDVRFKREIRLARSVCGPMQAGLEQYAWQLENRPGK